MSLRALLRTLGRRPARAGAGKAAAADAPARIAVHEDITALARATEQLQADVVLLRRLAAQSRELAHAEAEAAQMMAALATSLDLAAVTRHVRAAVAAAVVRHTPVPHALVEGLLPAAAFAATVNAIPSRLFFPEESTRQDAVDVPPRVSPAYVAATWMFLNDVANDLLGPVLRVRLAADGPGPSGPSGLKLSRSRVARIQAGAPALDEARDESWMTVVVSLGPVQPNIALVSHGGANVHEMLRTSLGLPAADTCYAWELSFAPAVPRRAARRRHGDVDSWAP